MKDKNKHKKGNPLKRLFHSSWDLIQGFFTFVGTLIEGMSRRWRLSISFKITFTFLGLFIFFYTLFQFNGILMTIIGYPLIAIFGSRAVKFLLKPIDEVTEVAKRLSGSNLKERIDVSEAHDELRDLTITLNTMLDSLHQSMEDQKAFISHASHELRTPLSVIKGYSDMLSRWGADDPDVREESIKAIKDESESMKALVEKLLMISRMDYGNIKAEEKLLSLSDLLKESANEFRLIKGSSITLKEHLPETFIKGDAHLIKELLRIFLDNAYKYSSSGDTITLSCGMEGKRAFFSIRDEGIGIDSEHLKHVFEPFYRADDSRTRATGGTGLGLSIAKKISTLIGAKLSMASEPGEGTLVTCLFSPEASLQPPSQPYSPAHQRHQQSHSHL